MDSHFGYAPVYAPTQPPEHRHGFTPVSTGPPSSGPNLSAYTTTLPPLSQNYSLHYSNDQSSHGGHSSQASYNSSNITASSQSPSYVAYSQQVPNQYNARTSYSQTPRHLPTSQGYSSLGLNASLHQAFSSSATQSGKLAEIRPMPTSGMADQPLGSSMPRMASHPSLAQLSTSQEEEPTHVVGSQGRRGTLPSANGRPVAVADTKGSTSATAGLKKDANDGKWPCEHCNKRYLHAKHLKRHLLRRKFEAEPPFIWFKLTGHADTGTRPYSCGLCRDTFSRSDILKRHFAKCSIRRGNPTGANHLTHSRATRKLKLEQGLEGSPHSPDPSPFADPSSHSVDFSSLAGLGNMSDLSNPDLGQPSFAETQRTHSTHISRTSSVKGAGKGTTSSNRSNYTAPNSAGLDGSGFSYSGGQATPDSLTTSGAATPYNYSNDPRSNQLSPHSNLHQSLNGLSLDLNSITNGLSGPSYSSSSLPHIVEASHDRTGDIDWSLPHLDSNDEYANAQYQSNSSNHHQHIKTEPQYSSGAYNMPHKYPTYQTAKQ